MRLGKTGALACALVALCAPAAAHAQVPVRTDAQFIKKGPKQAFLKAVTKLKRSPSRWPAVPGFEQYGELSWYDHFVAAHVYLSRCNPLDPTLRENMRGHAGPVFLPWHRAYLVLFEQALREVSGDPEVAVPYWNWTADSEKAVFSAGFMGSPGKEADGYAVTDGPFARGEWPLVVQNEGAAFRNANRPYITRNHDGTPAKGDTAGSPTLAADLFAEDKVYDIAPFDDSSGPKSFRNRLEGWKDFPSGPQPSLAHCGPDGFQTIPMRPTDHHNGAHTHGGGLLADGGMGTLTAVPASPNDPVFFMIHSQVDRLWAIWQRANPGKAQYVAEDGKIDEPMQPFADLGITITPRDVLDHEALGYRYDSYSPQPPATTSRTRTRAPNRTRSRARHANPLLCRVERR